MPNGSAPATAPNTVDTRATVVNEAVAQSDPSPPAGAAPEASTTNSVGQDLLIVALAGILAGAVSIIIAVIRRRKPVTAKLADFIAVAEGWAERTSAKVTAFRERKRTEALSAEFAPDADFGQEPQNVFASRLQSRMSGSQQPASAQPSLVPEQITMARPFVAPRQQARVKLDRRSRVE